MHKACHDAAAKGKGKEREESPVAGPSRPAKRPRVARASPEPTDLDSDELAAAVKEAGKAWIGMAKGAAEVAKGMKGFAEALVRMGEALDKHDL
jgi:hypothetical protein